MQLSIILLVAACIGVETAEQVLYRMGGRCRDRSMRFIGPGIALHFVWLTLWYFVLHAMPLGIALPLMGAQYVTVSLAGKFLFRERVDMQRWIGIAVITIGFVLIAANER